MQYKLKHETLVKKYNRNIMKIGKRFRKKKEEKTYEKENDVYSMFICGCRSLYL